MKYKDHNQTHRPKKLDHLTEAAADMIDFLDDTELSNLSGLSIEQIEKIREEHIKSE